MSLAKAALVAVVAAFVFTAAPALAAPDGQQSKPVETEDGSQDHVVGEEMC